MHQPARPTAGSSQPPVVMPGAVVLDVVMAGAGASGEAFPDGGGVQWPGVVRAWHRDAVLLAQDRPQCGPGEPLIRRPLWGQIPQQRRNVRGPDFLGSQYLVQIVKQIPRLVDGTADFTAMMCWHDMVQAGHCPGDD